MRGEEPILAPMFRGKLRQNITELTSTCYLVIYFSRIRGFIPDIGESRRARKGLGHAKITD